MTKYIIFIISMLVKLFQKWYKFRNCSLGIVHKTAVAHVLCIFKEAIHLPKMKHITHTGISWIFESEIDAPRLYLCLGE